MKKMIPVFMIIFCCLLIVISLLSAARITCAAAPEPENTTIPVRTEASSPTELLPAVVQIPEQPAGTTVPQASAPEPVLLTVPSGNEGTDVTYRCWDETVYATGVLYVRSGPGSEYPVIGKLFKGETVTRTAVGDNGWSRILFENTEAFVYTVYLSVTPIPVPTQTEAQRFGVNFHDVDDTVYAVGTNKLRSGPGFEYAVMGHLTTGSGARRVAVGDNGWSKIIFHDTEVYACSAYLSTSRESGTDPDLVTYYDTDDTIYAADHVNIRSGPGTDYEVVGQLAFGEAAERMASGDNGWSRIRIDGAEAYVCSAYVSTHPVEAVNTIVTSEPERPTPNSPFLFQYVAPEGILPHGFFSPVECDPEKPLPLIISLHGALEIGEEPHTLKSNFLTKEFRNWEYTGLDGFDAYIVCPQLTGYGYSDTWSCPESADKLFALIDYLKAHYSIDENKISIEGHSLGGQGALYMAADPRADFSAVILVSAYHPGVPYKHIDTQVRGFTGSPYLPAPREDWTSFNFMEEAFTEVFGTENLFMKSCSHYDIPMVALEEDADSNGKSDLIEWILAQ